MLHPFHFDCDAYLSGINSHNYKCLEHFVDPPLRIATIEIEDLNNGDDLAVGTKTKNFHKTPSVEQKNSYVCLDDIIQNEDGTYTLNIDSHCQDGETKYIWEIFYMHCLCLIDVNIIRITTPGYSKINQV